MDIQIIPATEADREFFVYVHHEAYRDVIEEMFGWDENSQDYRANRSFDGGSMYIIFHDKRKIGILGLEEHADYVWLKEIFILPEFQNKGIGTKIINDTIDQAEKVNKSVKLQTLKANLNAKKLYERLGFQVTEITDIHWKMENLASS